MSIQIKRGSRVPTINDLKPFQLGFNTNNDHLYINNNENIIDLNSITARRNGESNFFTFAFDINNIKDNTYSSTYFPSNAREISSSDQGIVENLPSNYPKLYKDIFINNLQIRIICWRTASNSYSHEVYFKNLNIIQKKMWWELAYNDSFEAILNPPTLSEYSDMKVNTWYRFDTDNLWYWNHRCPFSWDDDPNVTYLLLCGSSITGSEVTTEANITVNNRILFNLFCLYKNEFITENSVIL
jgi:hypothetical protein